MQRKWQNRHFHWTAPLRSSIPVRHERTISRFLTLIFLPKVHFLTVVRKLREVKSASWFCWAPQRKSEADRGSLVHSRWPVLIFLHEWQRRYDIRSAYPRRQRNMLMPRITSARSHSRSVCTLCSSWFGPALDLSKTVYRFPWPTDILKTNRRPGNQTHVNLQNKQSGCIWAHGWARTYP